MHCELAVLEMLIARKVDLDDPRTRALVDLKVQADRRRRDFFFIDIDLGVRISLRRQQLAEYADRLS